MTLKLGDIPIIANALKFGTTKSVRLLNSILGYIEFDRSSRTKIRNFSAFPPDFDLEKHKDKLLKELSLADFICVSNLLHIEIDAVADVNTILLTILKALTNLRSFESSLDVSFLSDEETQTINAAYSNSPSDTSNEITDKQIESANEQENRRIQ